jgi:hypothetical protein
MTPQTKLPTLTSVIFLTNIFGQWLFKCFLFQDTKFQKNKIIILALGKKGTTSIS